MELTPVGSDAATGADTGVSCNLGSCSGCCDLSNVCQVGDHDSQCGSEGQTCIDCTDEGQSCLNHTCQANPAELTWISIPGGTYQMGSETGWTDEVPIHPVTLSGFLMTESEVTVAQYGICVTEGPCATPSTGGICNWDASGYEDHPVNCVDWNKAVTFCTWAGGRLPNEAEWEYAAQSGGQGFEYPWGDGSATCYYAVMDDGSGIGCGDERTMAVCSKPAGNTSQGLCDMAGNVCEWVQDYYHDTYDGAPDDGSAWELPVTDTRSMRGGCFEEAEEKLYTTSRNWEPPEYAAPPADQHPNIGIRCAR